MRGAGASIWYPMRVARPDLPARGRRGGAVWLVAALLVMLAAPAAHAEFRGVAIRDNEFVPSILTVNIGDTVVWKHEGQRPHGVRSDNGHFDSSPGCTFQNVGPCMKNGDTFSITFQTPGTFYYHCPVHGDANGVGMAGHVTVASEEPPPTTRPPATTTTRPATTTTRRPATTAPGGATTTAPPTTVAGAQPTTTTAEVALPGEPLPTTTTLPPAPSTVVVSGDVDQDDGTNGPLIIAALVILAAALGAGAWYFRPGRPPPW